MRRILIENARRKARRKRGGVWESANLEDLQLATESNRSISLLKTNQAAVLPQPLDLAPQTGVVKTTRQS